MSSSLISISCTFYQRLSFQGAGHYAEIHQGTYAICYGVALMLAEGKQQGKHQIDNPIFLSCQNNSEMTFSLTPGHRRHHGFITVAVKLLTWGG